MKKFLLALCLLPAIAAAQAPAPYAKRWPLVLSAEQAGAYRVVLDREVYATTAWPDLRDIDVLDARGKPVAAALFGPGAGRGDGGEPIQAFRRLMDISDHLLRKLWYLHLYKLLCALQFRLNYQHHLLCRHPEKQLQNLTMFCLFGSL